MAYIPVPWCCVIYYMRQSHCRGSTVRLSVIALDLYDPNHKTACRSNCRTDIGIGIKEAKKTATR